VAMTAARFVGRGEHQQLFALLAQLGALADAVTRLRENQQRAAQAAAARSAAEQLYRLAPVQRTPQTAAEPGSRCRRWPRHAIRPRGWWPRTTAGAAVDLRRRRRVRSAGCGGELAVSPCRGCGRTAMRESGATAGHAYENHTARSLPGRVTCGSTHPCATSSQCLTRSAPVSEAVQAAAHSSDRDRCSRRVSRLVENASFRTVAVTASQYTAAASSTSGVASPSGK
jgi:hypothetical protein